MKNRYPSIKQALDNGYIKNYTYTYNMFRKKVVHILIEYNSFVRYPSGWSLKAEWYECSVRYWESVLYPKYFGN